MAHIPDFSVSPEVRALGLRVICAVVTNLKNRDLSTEFDDYRTGLSECLQKELAADFIKTDRVLAGFRELHEKVGRSNRKYPASPESLIQLFQSRGIIPRINLVVDIYNTVSVETRLALGAHDTDHISGNVSLRLTNGTERYIPLGSTTDEGVGAGEYCYVDDSNEVLCRLEHQQVEKTKVKPTTENCFFIVQGNRATSAEILEAGFQRLRELLSQFCGGSTVRVWREAL
jgi:DNA/RNA-binding domain of Phe-tRNA-synthetase-like protein